MRYITEEDVEKLKKTINSMQSLSNIHKDLIIYDINSYLKIKDEPEQNADNFGRKTITAKEGTAIITGERMEAIAGTWDLVELQHLFDEMDKLRNGKVSK